MAHRSSNRLRNKQTVELMNLRPTHRVLEIGCGPGLALVHCARTLTHGQVVGLDHSPVMIAQARERLVGLGLAERVSFVSGGYDDLAGIQPGFDRIFSLNVIQFISDNADFYSKAFEALKAGGSCFTTYQPRLDNDNPHGAASMADMVVGLMEYTGFRAINRTAIHAGTTPAVCVSGVKPAVA